MRARATLYVYLAADLKEDVANQARRRGLTLSEWVREALECYLQVDADATDEADADATDEAEAAADR